MARSYLAWGEPANEARTGAIAVLSRGSDPGAGHVGFLIGETGSSVILLGGNQGDAVTVAPFDRSRLLGLRWPRGAGLETRPAQPGPKSEIFERALAHVLEMEGGYTDDPFDPGGATNLGITLSVFARWKGVTADATSMARLKEELRHIGPDTAGSIYAARYWRPAGCGALLPPLALMHFDAAVNHGVGSAIRFLQEAVGTEPDGEIGPLTEAAIARAELRETLECYADIRRRRYRMLPHFWRFGRGWLARVDRTLARALEEAAREDQPPTPSEETSKGRPMNETASEQASAKWWGSSMTVWGTIITALATVLPALGPAFGYDITPDMVRDLGGQAVSAVQALAGLAGTLMTLYGRVRATQPLVRRMVSLRL